MIMSVANTTPVIKSGIERAPRRPLDAVPLLPALQNPAAVGGTSPLSEQRIPPGRCLDRYAQVVNQKTASVAEYAEIREEFHGEIIRPSVRKETNGRWQAVPWV
ncbi:hypothetical protein SAMN00790413_05210 [Deinococcus hopiensis KR-140]|uniref:Uncharacterized protein n=1 Tax=Deinococcus hopiensis KR-140 TaxID=695939 RepID=A0A1W1UUW0_9DEIO|nr:hypothetical protein SAMN00790413_05210 [Deinococcus hopiensis KR-140]